MPLHFSIGLTGGIGSGKSTVSQLFRERGATVIDTDQIAHALTLVGGTAIPAIEAQFGPEFITRDGAMDRQRMREYVFANPEAKQRLQSILHPMIRVEAARQAEMASGCYVVFDVPLLVESGNWKDRVDRVLVVDCPEDLQVARVKARSGLSDEAIKAIMAAQASRSDRLAQADDTIVNDGTPADVALAVEQLHQKYVVLAMNSETKSVQNL